MRITNTFGVHFIICTNRAKEKHALLYARFFVDEQRIEISLIKAGKKSTLVIPVRFVPGISVVI